MRRFRFWLARKLWPRLQEHKDDYPDKDYYPATEYVAVLWKVNKARRQRDTAREVVSFFASVIKSDEQWSEQCEAAMRRVYPDKGVQRRIGVSADSGGTE